MGRLLFIGLLLTFFSCRTKETNNAVVSESTTQRVSTVDTLRKKKFLIPFEFTKFKVDTFIGKIVSPNQSSNPTARHFRSAIKWAIDNFGNNFAGHYNLARWGCGTSCINGAITDLKTGNVYDLPPATLDYEFRKDSRLLVINPPDSTGYYDYCSYCEPELWLWDDDKKKFKRLN